MASVSYAFAFNSPSFSDRVLRLVIQSSNSSEEDSSASHRPSFSSLDSASFADLKLNKDGRTFCKQADKGSKIIDIHVNKIILAGHSEYFMKLFTSGMRESVDGAAITVQIAEAEEMPMMELLHFMYTSRLRLTEAHELGRLLPLVDRFRVSSCLEPCARVLSSLPDTLEKCLILLSLPEAIKDEPAFSTVMSRCKTFVGELFRCPKDKLQDFLSLPLAAVNAVLSYDGLVVATEEVVFEYAVAWATANCESESDQGRAMEELAPAVRFPWIEGNALLDDIATSPYMAGPVCQLLVQEALKFKASSHWRQQELGGDANNFSHRRYKARNQAILAQFLNGGVKTFVERQAQGGQCHVYFDFSLADVMCNGKTARSRTFSPNGTHNFALEAVLSSVTRYSDRYTCSLNIYEEAGDSGAASSEVYKGNPVLDYVVSMKTSSLQDYAPRSTGSVNLSPCQALGLRVTIQTLFDGWGSRGYPVGHLKPSWDAAFTSRVFICAKFTTRETTREGNLG